jgi:hypothetical protein
MATYETSLYIPSPVEKTFAFVSDFRNAQKWDPRTYAVEKVSGGPIGIGTTFLLTGGMLPKTGLIGARIPKAFLRGMPLEYRITSFSPPNEFVLEGENGFLTYQDRIVFKKEGSGTRLQYFARLDLKGVLGVGDLFLRVMFKRIGDDATKDIPDTIARAVAEAA